MAIVSPARVSRTRLRAAVLTYVVSAIAAAAGWWVLLGWDTRKTLGSDGYLHGPYGEWQVVALIAVLGVLSVWMGRRHSVVGGPTVAAISLAICFSISAQSGSASENDGLWPVGAVLLLIGSFAAITFVAYYSSRTENRKTRSRLRRRTVGR